MRLTIVLLLATAVALRVAQAAEQVPLADFARAPEYTAVKISPEGDYLAATLPDGDRTRLAIIELATRKVTGVLQFEAREQVYKFWWVGPQRVVASLATAVGSLAQPALTGELVGIDAGGGRQTYLYGFRGREGRVAATIDYGFADMIDPLPADPKTAIVSIDLAHREGQESSSGDSSAQTIDVVSGRRHKLIDSPLAGGSKFLTDHNGFVRYVSGEDGAYHPVSYARTPEQPEWHKLGGDLKNALIEPLSLSRDGRYAYLHSDENGTRGCLVREDLQNGERKSLACDDAATLASVIYSFDHDEPIATVYEAGRPTFKFLPTENPDRQRLLDLMKKSFPGELVNPVSATLDGSQVVLKVSGDQNPGEFYLYDVKTSKLTFLLASRSWIDPEKMAHVEAISFPSRDGKVTLHGYLTLPPGVADAKGLPLIVHPHGGPFGIRDHWEWEPDVQMLASRGYAVLQVNFRGSGGYGRGFLNAGKYSWGTTMIDDITDGARWVIAQGVADPKRVCVYGGSYGGYASLMSAVREPDLYRCTVGYAGVYDLRMFKQTSDIGESRHGRSYISEYIAKDDAGFAEQSPINHLDRLRAAVMIVHGEDDERVPFDQARALRKALEARNYPYEWLAKANEGHGFYSEKNKLELYQKLLAFFDTNIGSGAEPGKVPPAPAN